MTRRMRWMLGGAAVALAALLAWALTPSPPGVELAVVGSGPFEAGIEEEGRTRLRERFVVSAPLAGQLERPLLREGDAVRAGDVVARLDPLLPALLDDRARREQQARVEAAAAGVQAARARAEVARVGLTRASQERQRTESLGAQGFVSPDKVDTDRLAEQAAQRELQAAFEGERVARFELEGAQAAFAAIAAGAQSAQQPALRARQLLLRAPVEGRVLKVHLTSRATVPAGAPLLEIGDLGRLEIVAQMLTTDAQQLRAGSPVHIEGWGGPQALVGVVRQVEPAAFTKVSALGVEEQRVNVLMDLKSPPQEWAGLGDGWRVSVRVVTHQADQALRVPVSAVFPRPASMPADPACTPAAAAGGVQDAASLGCAAVFVVESGRARLRPVRLRARNTRMAWVEAGLHAGSEVVVYPGAALRDGSRVRVRAPALSG